MTNYHLSIFGEKPRLDEVRFYSIITRHLIQNVLVHIVSLVKSNRIVLVCPSLIKGKDEIVEWTGQCFDFFRGRMRLIPAHVAEGIAVAKALKTFNLKPAKRIELKFDPFHKDVKSIRDFLYYTSASRYRLTNPKCFFKTEVCNDRSEPILKVTLVDKKEIVFKTSNLTCQELMRQFNMYVSDLDKSEPEAAPAPTTTVTKGKRARK